MSSYHKRRRASCPRAVHQSYISDRNATGKLPQQGYKRSSDKIELSRNSLEFYGHRITREDLKADPEKITAHICNLGAKPEWNGQLFESIST